MGRDGTTGTGPEATLHAAPAGKSFAASRRTGTLGRDVSLLPPRLSFAESVRGSRELCSRHRGRRGGEIAALGVIHRADARGLEIASGGRACGESSQIKIGTSGAERT